MELEKPAEKAGARVAREIVREVEASMLPVETGPTMRATQHATLGSGQMTFGGPHRTPVRQVRS